MKKPALGGQAGGVREKLTVPRNLSHVTNLHNDPTNTAAIVFRCVILMADNNRRRKDIAKRSAPAICV